MPWSPQQAFPAARGPLLQMALSAPGREQARAERLGISRREASLNVCRGQHIDQIIDVLRAEQSTKKKPAWLPPGGRARAFRTNRLEDHLGSELEGAGIIGTGDLADISTADRAVNASTIYISAELRVVPDVISFITQF